MVQSCPIPFLPPSKRVTVKLSNLYGVSCDAPAHPIYPRTPRERLLCTDANGNDCMNRRRSENAEREDEREGKRTMVQIVGIAEGLW